MQIAKFDSIKSKDLILLVEDHWSSWDKTHVSYLFPRFKKVYKACKLGRLLRGYSDIFLRFTYCDYGKLLRTDPYDGLSVRP